MSKHMSPMSPPAGPRNTSPEASERRPLTPQEQQEQQEWQEKEDRRAMLRETLPGFLFAVFTLGLSLIAVILLIAGSFRRG